MTAILGISAFYHDSAAALVVDGEDRGCRAGRAIHAQEARLWFPQNAIDYCLREAGLTPAELDYVGFYDKPFLKFERLLETYLAFAPVGIKSFFARDAALAAAETAPPARDERRARQAVQEPLRLYRASRVPRRRALSSRRPSKKRRS